MKCKYNISKGEIDMSKVLEISYGQEKEKGYDYRTAMEEANRCLLCEDAPCSKGCPAGTDPGKFIRSLKFKNIKGASETIRENNPLGGSCAWVCPYDRMCEKECSRTGIDVPIKIGKIQRFLVEQEQQSGDKYVQKKESKGKKVACIGAGPASLACARQLALYGISATVFEKKEKAGGVLTYGITPTRLPQEVIDFDVKLIEELGVEFKFNTEVTKEMFEQIKKDYDAVFVGIGLWESKKVDIKGANAKGVEYAVDFLENTRTGKIKSLENEKVIIIGGGNVAMDCAAAAAQLKADAKIVYRRTIKEAPADSLEIAFVRDMGVAIHTEFAPEEIIEENGKVVALKCKGRDGYSGMIIKADRIVFAIGQSQTSIGNELIKQDNVIIGGDAATENGATVVEAVANGKLAAYNLKNQLR